MILTVTLNPLLEIRLDYTSSLSAEVIRNGSLTYAAGGKGINVSRQLKHLGLDSLIFTTASGPNGKRLAEYLEKDNLKSVIYKTSAETRISVLVSNPEKQQNYFSQNAPLTAIERDEIKNKIVKILPTVDTVVFSGSTPDKESVEIIAQVLKYAQELDKLTILDYYGKGLDQLLDIPPVIIHNNIKEIETSLGKELKTEESTVEIISYIHQKGVRQIYLTDGDNAFYASNNGYLYKVKPPVVNLISSVGCGDAFVAGIIYSLNTFMKFEEGLAFATALGALEATKKDVCRNSLPEIMQMIPEVVVTTFGKRMNEFNVPRAN